jgi:hypothetical protein
VFFYFSLSCGIKCLKKLCGRSRFGDSVTYRGKRVPGKVAFSYSTPALLFFFVDCRAVRNRSLGRQGDRGHLYHSALFPLFSLFWPLFNTNKYKKGKQEEKERAAG